MKCPYCEFDKEQFAKDLFTISDTDSKINQAEKELRVDKTVLMLSFLPLFLFFSLVVCNIISYFTGMSVGSSLFWFAVLSTVTLNISANRIRKIMIEKINKKEYESWTNYQIDKMTSNDNPN